MKSSLAFTAALLLLGASHGACAASSAAPAAVNSVDSARPAAVGAPGEAAVKQQVNAFIDEWHDDAAHARPAYFDKIASDGVYIGTDKTELWTRDQFKAWARKIFERKSAWTFKAIKRNIHVSAGRDFIWFDELLDTQMGVCQASGVIRRTAGGFEIAHYQLSIAVPNGVADRVTAAIRQFEAKPGAK